MRYTVERQWAVVDGHRGKVVEVYETEGDAYRAAYKKERASQIRERRKRMKEAVSEAANGAGFWPIGEGRTAAADHPAVILDDAAPF